MHFFYWSGNFPTDFFFGEVLQPPGIYAPYGYLWLQGGEGYCRIPGVNCTLWPLKTQNLRVWGISMLQERIYPLGHPFNSTLINMYIFVIFSFSWIKKKNPKKFWTMWIKQFFCSLVTNKVPPDSRFVLFSNVV